MLLVAYSYNDTLDQRERTIEKTFIAKVKRFMDKPGMYVNIPFNCETEFGANGKIKVSGTINNQKIKATILTHDSGGYYILITKGIRVKCNIHLDDEVTVSIQKEESTTQVPIPADLSAALKNETAAHDFFSSLDIIYRRQFILWVAEAKREETRHSRIRLVIRKLLNKQKLK